LIHGSRANGRSPGEKRDQSAAHRRDLHRATAVNDQSGVNGGHAIGVARISSPSQRSRRCGNFPCEGVKIKPLDGDQMEAILPVAGTLVAMFVLLAILLV
jgi:hypothetical protein